MATMHEVPAITLPVWNLPWERMASAAITVYR
jgi:hypothetical protein